MPSRFVIVLSTLLLSASGVGGQVLPGASLDSPTSVRARFMQTVLAEVREPLSRWSEAWTAHDRDGVAEAYTEDAYLVTAEGTTVTGREAIRRHFGRAADRLGTMELFLQDADASHRMLMTMCRYVLEPGSPGLGGAREAGSVMSVWVQDGRTWRIRAQVFTRER